jgi:hypothetical protein
MCAWGTEKTAMHEAMAWRCMQALVGCQPWWRLHVTCCSTAAACSGVLGSP